jgi:hypothetical protein
MRAMKTMRGAALAVLVAGAGCELVAGVRTDVGPYPAGSGGAAMTCGNGKKDGDETGKDCGGPCAPCAIGEGCGNGADCESKSCANGTCLAAACDDKIHNGNETDTDCGGMTCPKCGAGKACAGDGDCAGGSCVAGACAATCSDGEKNQNETGIDCGGGCEGCAIDEACAVGTDCESGVCKAGACTSFHVWSKRFGGADKEEVGAVAVDKFGRVILTGTAEAIDFGGGALSSMGGPAVILAKLDDSGAHMWSRMFNNGHPQDVAESVAVDDSCHEIHLTGQFSGTIDFGNGPIVTSNKPSIFVAHLDDTGSSPTGSRPGLGTGTSTATGASCEVATTGKFFAMAKPPRASASTRLGT